MTIDATAPLRVQRYCALCLRHTAHEDAAPKYSAWRCLTCGSLLHRRLEELAAVDVDVDERAERDEAERAAVRRAYDLGVKRGEVRVGGQRYPLIGDEERVDRADEDSMAERSRELWPEQAAAVLAERERARRRLPRGVRLDAAITAVPRDGLPAPVASHTPGRGGAGDPAPAPRAVGGRERDLRERVALIDHHIRMIERIADEEQGLVAPIGDGRLLTTRERNRIVWNDFQGVRSDVVAREAPYLGSSARTIERARVSESLERGVLVRPVDGTIVGERPAARS